MVRKADKQTWLMKGTEGLCYCYRVECVTWARSVSESKNCPDRRGARRVKKLGLRNATHCNPHGSTLLQRMYP